MEGFLLVFSHERSAQVQYCVLEHGLLCYYNQPGETLRESVQLTRHRIRVQPLFNNSAGLCPNRFALHVLEVKRSDQAGVFVSGKHEKTYLFAAATSTIMVKWANAIQNWRRHAFDDPTRSALSIYDTTVCNTKQKAVLLESQRATLVNMASRFDVKLISRKRKVKARSLFSGPSFRVSSTHKTPTEMKMFKPGFTVISWLSGISSLRISQRGR